ncbi:SDR family NAD(P)-dependent oxidoreductase [Falsochrobactrum shanghaiense]|nr:SDR family NAD(P)-dependent oxidoreductase [Falsochrobactrum shanghaiense]
MADWTGRAVLITGASKNIGRAMAEAFGAQGASVMVHTNHDRRAAEETVEAVVKAGGSGSVILGNLEDQETPARLVAATVEAFGRLDCVVANAAVRPHCNFAQLTFAQWRQVMAISLDSVFLLAQAAGPELAKSDRASFVSIGGLTAHTGAKDRPHVIAAKAGLSGLTRALAHEWGGQGTTVNCVAPGLVDTVRVGEAPAHHVLDGNVLRRFGTVQEIAQAVLTIAGPNMRYVTGQTIHVNGGAYMS